MHIIETMVKKQLLHMITWGIGAVGSALHSHCRGRGFESHMLHFFCALFLLFSLTPVTVEAEALPTAPHVELHNVANGVQITWGNVSHAYEYVVYRSGGGGSFEPVATLRKQNAWKYVDEKTKNMEGERFTYKIGARAKQNVYEESESEEVSIIRLAPVTALKLKNGEGLSIDCSWEEHPNADGYEVRVAAEGQKRFIQIKRTTLNEITLIDIYNTKTYRVQVRPYKEGDGKYYFGNWCNAKKIRARR